MLNKRIRGMIDDIFSELKMSAENLALRDELMANAQDRYEDLVQQGMEEEEAFREVAASLGDVRALVKDMNTENLAEAAKLPVEPEEQPEEEAPAQEEPEETEAPEEAEEPAEADKAASFDLGDMLNKTVSAIGDFGQQIMPQTKKVVREVDKATGGILMGMGKAVNKGMREAQKAAGDVIDRMNAQKQPEPEPTPERGDAEALRREAEGLRADACIKEAVGDTETAAKMRGQADALEARANTIEQAAIEAALREAQLHAQEEEASPFAEVVANRNKPVKDEEKEVEIELTIDLANTDEDEEDEADETVESEEVEEAEEEIEEEAEEEAAEAEEEAEEKAEEEAEEEKAEEEPEFAKADDCVGADGTLDEDAFSKVVESIAQDAGEAARQAGEAARRVGEELHKAVKEATKEAEVIEGRASFPAAGLRAVEIALDADSVHILPSESGEIEVEWEKAENAPAVAMDNHTLTIRSNPDVFKSFFSIFHKGSGEVTVRVPRGYAADYEISTVSGNIRLYELDVDDLKVGTTSGSIRLEPNAATRAKEVEVNSVSGDVTVSVTADAIDVDTVSGAIFVSCDAEKVDTHSVSGKTHIEGNCDEWESNSVSGAIEFFCTTVPGRSVKLSTISSSATVVLPEEIRGFVAELNGKANGINNEFGPTRYGTCALPIHMESLSGKLNIRQL